MKMLSSIKQNNWNVSAKEAQEQISHLELAFKESHNIFQSDCINVLIWRQTNEIMYIWIGGFEFAFVTRKERQRSKSMDCIYLFVGNSFCIHIQR